MSRARTSDGSDVDSVSLTREGDWYVAVAEGTDLASQGRTVPEALANLAEVLRLRAREGESIAADEEEAVLEELGIDPDEVAAAREESDGPPDALE